MISRTVRIMIILHAMSEAEIHDQALIMALLKYIDKTSSGDGTYVSS